MSATIRTLLRDMAIGLGCPPTEVDALWVKHCELVDKDGGDYGGERWRGLVVKHVKDRVPTLARTDPEVSAMRRREAEAKIVEDNAYAAGAVSLREWLDDLRVKPDFSETLTPVEEQLVAAPAPQAGEDAAMWLIRTLRPVRLPRTPR